MIWACNSVSTNLHHWAIVQDAKKKGAKVVVIDSYKSRTAKQGRLAHFAKTWNRWCIGYINNKSYYLQQLS